jgi:hypothetical protein
MKLSMAWSSRSPSCIPSRLNTKKRNWKWLASISWCANNTTRSKVISNSYNSRYWKENAKTSYCSCLSLDCKKTVNAVKLKLLWQRPNLLLNCRLDIKQRPQRLTRQHLRINLKTVSCLNLTLFHSNRLQHKPNPLIWMIKNSTR